MILRRWSDSALWFVEQSGDKLGRITTADIQALKPVQEGPVHTALVGLDDGFGASALRFLPADLTVRRGEYVVWTWPGEMGEPHTVSFLSGAPAPEDIEPRPQPSGPPLLVIPAHIVQPPGGTTYTGQGVASSGMLGNLAGVGNFALRFDAPVGTYAYQWLLHSEMKGTITVIE
jgi:plastocyanin